MGFTDSPVNECRFPELLHLLFENSCFYAGNPCFYYAKIYDLIGFVSCNELTYSYRRSSFNNYCELSKLQAFQVLGIIWFAGINLLLGTLVKWQCAVLYSKYRCMLHNNVMNITRFSINTFTCTMSLRFFNPKSNLPTSSQTCYEKSNKDSSFGATNP